MGRWPDPVRPPLPVGRVTGDDISEAWTLTTRYLDDPEDPAFDQAMFGFVGAVRAALAECEEALDLARISDELAAEDEEDEPTYRKMQRAGEVYVAQKVSRAVIDALRHWVPEQRA